MAKHRKRFVPPEPDLVMDMSPMIDLVFLLLIFFLTNSQMINYLKDPNVKVPVADSARVPKLVQGRIVFNVYNDGQILSERSVPLTPAEVTRIVAQRKTETPDLRLHVRADRRTPHEAVQKLIAASAEAGVTDVIFSTYVTDR